MLSDFQIIGYRYLFDSNIDLQERNFFNYETTPILQETFDLKPYIISCSELQFDFDMADDDGYYFKPSEINLNFGGRINDKEIVRFLDLFGDQLYYKFIIEIKYLGTSIWKGILNPESFKENFKPSPDTEQVSISVFGYEKEFAEFFQNIMCTDLLGYGFQYDADLQVYSYDFISGLRNCFTRLGVTPFVNFDAESDISNFRINDTRSTLTNYNAESATAITSINYDYVFLKTSHKNIVDKKENKFDWFKRILTSMGWVFYFEGNTLYVKNKRPYVGTLANIEKKDILEWEFTKQFANSGFDHVVIEDSFDSPSGYFLEKYNLGDLVGELFSGQKSYVFSSAIKNFLQTTPFRNYYINNGYKFVFYTGQEINTIDESDDSFFINSAKVTWVDSTNKDTFLYTGTRYQLNPKRVLKLDTGKAEGRYIPANKERDEYEGFKYWNTIIPNDIRLLYRITDVNYGNMMFRKVGTKYETYQDYIRGSQMQRNMRAYTNDKTVRRIKVKVRGLLFENKQSKFVFGDLEDIRGDYSANTISYNLLDKTTTLELEQVI